MMNSTVVEAVLAAISGILAIIAGPSYLVGIIKGTVRPQRMTWFIFGALGVIAFIAQLDAGASWSLVFSGLDLLGSLVVFGLSLWRGTGGSTRLDWLALTIATIGMIVSVIAREPVVAILGVILADISGMWLTLVKVWRDPDSEIALTWLLFATAGVFGVLTIRHWTWGIVLYPAYLAAVNYTVPLVQTIRRRMLSRTESIKKLRV
ncbi:MAG TPA: hypothetical protein VFQ70_03645 [Candidatus Saccharimonadaceae bacterium]|nr:hypothetical protein [Candidatus Saccharimonadaceae bacterium]